MTALFITQIFNFTSLNSSNYDSVHAIGLNWNRSVIGRINKDGTGCIGEEELLIKNSWPGTISGCYCSNLGIFQDRIKRSSCNRKHDSILFCSTVESQPPVNYAIWKGRSLCGAVTKESYLDLNIYSKSNLCPMYSRSCGIIDSLNNVLCVKSNQPCPINKMLVLEAGQSTPGDMNYTAIVTSNGQKILFSNENTEGKILVELMLSDLQPCADTTYADYSSIPYVLDPFYLDKFSCDKGIGSFKYDERYNKVDSYVYNNVLSDNNIQKLTSTLPLYNKSLDNHTTSLYSRNYIGLDTQCLKELKQNGDQKVLEDLLNIKERVQGVHIMSLVSMIIASILLIFIVLAMIVISKKGEENSNKKNCICSFLALFGFIALFIMCILMSIFLSPYGSDDNFIQREDCVDKLTYESARIFYTNTLLSRKLSIFGIFSCILLVVISVAKLLINIKSSRKN